MLPNIVGSYIIDALFPCMQDVNSWMEFVNEYPTKHNIRLIPNYNSNSNGLMKSSRSGLAKSIGIGQSDGYKSSLVKAAPVWVSPASLVRRHPSPPPIDGYSLLPLEAHRHYDRRFEA
ncbi:hypothetical protein KSP40_PGU022172 [Platanthera guangdongensis]|uniref:Uncharacterized protein n=1 Tax=Platanthera guangdongensis TaxID=2320717 RepID=A0ABR2LVK7_9ASPA